MARESDDEHQITETVNRCESLTRQFNDLVSSVCVDVEKHNDYVIQERRKAAQVPPPIVVAPKPEVAVPKAEVIRSISPEAYESVHPEDLARYTELIAELERYESKATAFSSNPAMKTTFFDLQRGPLVSVNTISDQTSQHLLDKLQVIRKVLHGEPIKTDKGNYIRVSDYDGALEYFKYQLASRLVDKGETDICINPNAAFPIAAIITELWIEFPDFGRLVLAHFYRKCPFLVPYYPVCLEGQNQEDYYKSLGYKYIKGKVELQPAYIKRMSGFVRLYSAIFITRPRQSQCQHPHGLHEAWRFLAALLNTQPQSDITATVLNTFLTVTGNKMSQEYGRQLSKVLVFICKDFITRIKQVSLGGESLSFTFRLEDFLQEAIIRGQIRPPGGEIPPNFW